MFPEAGRRTSRCFSGWFGDGEAGSGGTRAGWGAGCHPVGEGERDPQGRCAGTSPARCLVCRGWSSRPGDEAPSRGRRKVPARAALCRGRCPPGGTPGGHCPRRHSAAPGPWREGFTLEHLFCFCSLEQDTCFSHKQSHKFSCKQVSRGRKSGAGMTATGSCVRR